MYSNEKKVSHLVLNKLVLFLNLKRENFALYKMLFISPLASERSTD
jgi:hypothetical protein